MKTINEEIEEFAKGEFYDVVDGDFFTEEDVKRFVRYGVDLVQQWIPVSEELPAIGLSIIAKFYCDGWNHESYDNITEEQIKNLAIHYDYWRPIQVE